MVARRGDVTGGRRRLLFGAAAALASCALPARAAGEGVPAADEAAVRKVVESQLAAFRADDARRAFSFASPAIQAQFGSAEVFIGMVREQYKVVYRPASVRFLKAERIDGQTLQPVRMTDADGVEWMAVYQMERQRGGGWRIGGVQLAQGRGRST